jgi:hypothetical protein
MVDALAPGSRRSGSCGFDGIRVAQVPASSGET